MDPALTAEEWRDVVAVGACQALTHRASGISAYQCAQDSAHRRDMKSLTDAAAIAAGGIAAGAASPTRP